MTPGAEAQPAGPWQPLDTAERRILGVLVEKQKTTADAYPLIPIHRGGYPRDRRSRRGIVTTASGAVKKEAPPSPAGLPFDTALPGWRGMLRHENKGETQQRAICAEPQHLDRQS